MSCPELLREHILDLFRSLEPGLLPRRLLDLLLPIIQYGVVEDCHSCDTTYRERVSGYL